jgi:nucleoside-diphosphate-sugar epimerase
MAKRSNAKKEPKQGKLIQKKEDPERRMIDVVTGPTSGIGIRLIKKLLEKGDEVRIIVLDELASGHWQFLPGGVIPYKADIRLKNPDDEGNLRAACSGADRIFHLAALTDVTRNSSEDYIQINVIGTENVLKAFVDSNPQEKDVQFIYLSTTAVYGNKRPGETLTEDSDTRPSRLYGETKFMAEQVIKSFALAHPSIKYTIFRASTMYGPNYMASFDKIFKYLVENKLRYIGNGNNHITLTHVDDVVDGMLACVGKENAYDKIYNLTDGEAYTLKQLFDKAAKFLDAPVPSKHMHPALALLGAKVLNINMAELNFLLSDRIVSISKIHRELGFHPKRSMDIEGKEQALEFLKKYKSMHGN